MNKHEISKVVSFINEVERLPNELLSPSDCLAFTSNGSTESDKKIVYEKQNDLFKTIKDIKIRLLAYFRALPGDNSTYIELIGEITFRPKLFVFNTIHFENNKAWLDDKRTLLNLLFMAKAEFEERIRIAKQNPENSYIGYFKSNEAKGIILAAVLTIITGFVTKDLWWNRIFSSHKAADTEISQHENLIIADKNAVISKTAKEVFTSYYQTIESLKNMYAAVSAEGHIQDYLKIEVSNINMRILNKSYIHRFASNERFWSDADLRETSQLIKNRTIDRIKEISEDIESKAQGGFMLSDDRLNLLEKEVQVECGCK